METGKKYFSKTGKILLCLMGVLMIILCAFNETQVQGADTTEFLNIEVVEGSEEISGVSSNAAWISSDDTVATFSSGRIWGHREGIADLTIRMTDGGTKTVHASVYTKYPQPRSAEISNGSAGLRLLKYAEFGGTAYIGTPLQGGQVVTVLCRVQDQVHNRLMQLVRTAGGDEGWIPSTESNDRAMNPYYHDAKPGEVLHAYNHNSGTPFEDSTWHMGDDSIASVRSEPYDGYRNQPEITAKREGYTSLTATAGKVRTSTYISVYTPMSNIKGIVRNETAVRSGAGDSSRAVSLAVKGKTVTISGKCSSYWRVGENQFIPVADVDIPATDIQLDRSKALLYADGIGSGDASALQLQALVKPTIDGRILATGDVVWSSSQPEVAQVSGGKVTAGKAGKTVITASIDRFKATCEIEVCIPVTKAELPPATVVKLKQKKAVKAVCTPSDLKHHQVRWELSGNGVGAVKPVAGAVHSGAYVTGGSQENTGIITLTVTPPKPTVGTAAPAVKTTGFLSVYKTQSFQAETVKNNVKLYAGAKADKKLASGTIAKRYTLVKVIGSCKKFYVRPDRALYKVA